MKRLWGTLPRVKRVRHQRAIGMLSTKKSHARQIHQHTFYPVATDQAFSQLDPQKKKRADLGTSVPLYLPPEACGLRQLAAGDFVEAIVAGIPYWGVVTTRQPFTLEMLDSDGINREVPVDCVTFGLYGFTELTGKKERLALLSNYLNSVSYYHSVAMRKLSTIHSLFAKQAIPWSVGLDEITETLLKISPAINAYSWSAAALASHIAVVNQPRYFRCDYAQTADYDSWSPLNYVALPIDIVSKLELVVHPDNAARSIKEFTAIALRYMESTEHVQHRHLPLRALFTAKQSYDTWDAVVVFLRHYVEYPHRNLMWVVPEILGSWYRDRYEGHGDPYDPYVVREFLERINETTPSGPGSVFLAGPNDIAFTKHRLPADTTVAAEELELTDGNSTFFDYCSQKFTEWEPYTSVSAAQFLHKWRDPAYLLDRHIGFGIYVENGVPEFLHLHVPDVTQTVPVKSSVLSVVGQRSYSLDTVEGRLDMLPGAVADELALTGEGRRRVMTVTVRLQDGKLPESITPDLLFVSFGTVEFEELTESNNSSRALTELLQEHYDYRLSHGALPGFAKSNKNVSLSYQVGEVSELPKSIFLSSVEYQKDDQIAPRNEKVSILHATEDLDVLSEARILMNRLGAIYASENKLAVMYRQQQDPLHAEKSDHPLNRKIQSLYFEKEHFSDTPGPHESLGLDSVIQIASPIDSLEDIVNQHQLYCKYANLCASRRHGEDVVNLATLRGTPKVDWLAPAGKEEYTPLSDRWHDIQDDVCDVLEEETPRMILELPQPLSAGQLRSVYLQYLRPRQRLTDRAAQLVERYWKILWIETQNNFAYKCVVTRPALTYKRDPITKLSTRARAYCIDLDMEVEVEVGDLQLERGDRLVSMGVVRANKYTGELVLCV
ncbi:YALI0E27390p [Yarrowia lipolytica CLIB122]|jgi:hypothetical protein|uniref:YALI0E27390p n=2 Tax=Yarrowia lipolytica TaxID=4952 RepID=Q6C4E7_YARLI|nr:YALI0E27390p [Yarrowia lipolytica CLIB122]AOW06036.1 hypothetical protein YALI1_E32361g [Yarrowia lipolytica]KAB8281462.1 RNB domain-containing protein [Yarrowia lipolytica]KAE8175225.1 RNB domain-containing protein [Yarrowia lipolytica]KAJ8057438.1 RNB domain-containing protein [Yarrowia lipolytica]RMI98686.1 RNB domain-containing protein [Yarrowia lipolytica]|eukprot:XP_504465.1 YALI0E27390p [Yarrowia lipolytica CLIB122]